MPKLLSEIDLPKSASFGFSTDIISQNPHLAVHAMQTIARWSLVDLTLGTLLSSMMNTGVEEALALYELTWGHDRRTKVLETIAGIRLEDDARCLLVAALRVIDPWRTERDTFAHRIWGSSPQVPNALLLADPTLRIFMDYRRGGVDTPSTAQVLIAPSFDHAKIQVYDEDALKKAARVSATAYDIVNLLANAIRDCPDQERSRTALLAYSEIKRRLGDVQKGKSHKPKKAQKKLKTA